jgi:DNA-binding SARP family transcriptional activator
MPSTYEVVQVESMRLVLEGVRLVVVLDHPAAERAYRVACVWDDQTEAFEDYRPLKTWANDAVERDVTPDEAAALKRDEAYRYIECNDDLEDKVRAFAIVAALDARAEDAYEAHG